MTFSIFGVVIEPVALDFGSTMAAVALGNGIVQAVMGLASPLVGPVLDRRSIRGVMLVGTFVLAVGLLLLTRVPELWHVGAMLPLVGVGATLIGPLPASALITKVFGDRRGRALGISATGTTIASLSIPPLAAYLIAEFGWRDAIATLAIGGAALTLPIIWAWARVPGDRVAPLGPASSSAPPGPGSPSHEISNHETPEHENPNLATLEPGSLPAAAPVRGPNRTGRLSTRELLRDLNFWVNAVVFGLLFSSGTVMMVFLVPYSGQLGIEARYAAFLLTLRGVFGLVGRTVFGVLSDRVDNRLLLWIVIALQSALWLVMISKPEPILLACAIAGLGLSGAIFPLSNSIPAKCFGADTFGRATGFLNLCRMPFTIVAVPFAGYLYDTTGDYSQVFRFFLYAFAAAALALFFLRIPVVEPGREPRPASA
jgi:MFS family permease